MPDTGKRCPDNWYSGSTLTNTETSRWYDYNKCEAVPEPSQGTPGSSHKKLIQTKRIMLAVCACILLISVGAVLWKVFMRDPSDEISASVVYPGGESVLPEAEEFDDYKEYFDNYYSAPAEDQIKRAEIGTGVTLVLHPQEGEELPLQEIYELVSPAVVGVTCRVDGEDYSWGTGVLFTEDGYLITNDHVVDGVDEVFVTFSDGTEWDACLVGRDSISDIAVMKIERADCPFAEFGESDELRVGDFVAAIGNPLGQEYAWTLTDGIVSAIDRSVSNNGHSMTLLQTNAALNEGNSGGPLINAHGQVVGITNMKIMSSFYSTVEGIGFAIPSSVVKRVADELIEIGTVTGAPTIGILAGAVSSEAMMLYDLPAGVYVTLVNDGSDAKEKGLEPGDIITEVNGIKVESVADVNSIKDGFSIGDTLTLTVYRDGDTFEMEIVLVDSALID